MPEMFTLANAGKVAGLLKGFAVDAYRKCRAASRAVEGSPLSDNASLPDLVRREVEKFARAPTAPGMNERDVLQWATSVDSIELVCGVMLARAGGAPGLANADMQKLAGRYEVATGERRELAVGAIRLLVDHVWGQLSATHSAALSLALEARNSADLRRLLRPADTAPLAGDWARLRGLALGLVDAGKLAWRMPTFLAPLSLEMSERQADSREQTPITTSEVLGFVRKGERIILFGEGGIGKTTYLLHLADAALGERSQSTPIYIDAAMWARSAVGFMDYVAARPAGQAQGVSAGELVQHAKAGNILLLINGWNELPDARRTDASIALTELLSQAPAMAVVVTSRTERDVPAFEKVRRVAVRGISWRGQRAIIREELGEAAGRLIDQLASDAVLRGAAKSPLVLRGLLAQARTKAIASSSMWSVLEAVVDEQEQLGTRDSTLKEPPTFGLHRVFLEELACRLTEMRTTTLNRVDAMQAIEDVCRMPASNLVIGGSAPAPASILRALGSQHVLHIDGEVVRFSHHRLQEYFAAKRVADVNFNTTDRRAWLVAAMNQPAWHEPIRLVAEHWSSGENHRSGRVELVRAAVELSLPYACELIGLAGFSETDDKALHEEVVRRVNALATCEVATVRRMGIECQARSRLPCFESLVFEALYRSLSDNIDEESFDSMSVLASQFSPALMAQSVDWPTGHRLRLLERLSEDRRNFSYVVHVATAELNNELRASALRLLFWLSPDSDSALDAWLGAPEQLQAEVTNVDDLHEAAEASDRLTEVSLRVQQLMRLDLPAKQLMQFAIHFPEAADSRAIELAIHELAEVSKDGWANPSGILELLERREPGRALRLLHELLSADQPLVPGWMAAFMAQRSDADKNEVFAAAWRQVLAGKANRLSSELLASYASPQQVRVAVEMWLTDSAAWRDRKDEVEQARRDGVRHFVHGFPTPMLLAALRERAPSCDAASALVLVDLLLSGLRPENTIQGPVYPQFVPGLADIQPLLDVFEGMCSASDRKAHDLSISLAELMSYVDAERCKPKILEALDIHLTAWATYRAEREEWAARRSGPQPMNPQQGNLPAALASCGFGISQELLERLKGAMDADVVISALLKLAIGPWQARQPRRNWGGVSGALGHDRRAAGRVFLQPDSEHQLETDAMAGAVGTLLDEALNRALEEREKLGDKWTPFKTGGLGRFAARVALFPSREVLAPVLRTLRSGLVDKYGFKDSVQSLMSQGWKLEDPAVFEQLETLLDTEFSEPWHQQSEWFTLGELTRLVFMSRPPLKRRHDLATYIGRWRRHGHISKFVEMLGECCPEDLLDLLVELERAKEVPTDRDMGMAMAKAAVTSLASGGDFKRFLALISDGTFFRWVRDDWTLKGMAPAIAAAIGGAPARSEAFLEACAELRSLDGDQLACSVMKEAKLEDETQSRYCLAAAQDGRCGGPDAPAYRRLYGMFRETVPLGGNMFEDRPRASNLLRAELYGIAKRADAIAPTARRLLASVENSRRRERRPDAELLHPVDPRDGEWTRVLLLPTPAEAAVSPTA